MPAKTASNRITAKVSSKSVRGTGAKTGAKKAHLSKLEAKRLEQFKALMEKYLGKAMFAGFDA
jgi:hypothetical protein